MSRGSKINDPARQHQGVCVPDTAHDHDGFLAIQLLTSQSMHSFDIEISTSWHGSAIALYSSMHQLLNLLMACAVPQYQGPQIRSSHVPVCESTEMFRATTCWMQPAGEEKTSSENVQNEKS